MQTRTDWACARKLEDLRRARQALHAHWAKGRALHEALSDGERLLGKQDGAWGRHLLHAGCHMRGLAHSGVVHAEV